MKLTHPNQINVRQNKNSIYTDPYKQTNNQYNRYTSGDYEFDYGKIKPIFPYNIETVLG